jgi:hypothetical protein
MRPVNIATAAAALVCGLLLAGSPVVQAQRQPGFPAPLEAYLSGSARLTPEERSALQGGQPVTKLLDSDITKEVAILGAIWIAAPPAEYLKQVQDIERFEQGGAFLETRRISDPPRADDFSSLTLPDEDIEDLRGCRIDDCAVKLGADALNTFRTEIDWTKPTAVADANAIFRRLALQYVQAYQQGGNARLAVYRDKAHPTFVEREFRSMIDRLPPLATHLPELRRYLLDYPGAALPGSSSLFYWQKTEFGLKPLIRVSHMVIEQDAERSVVASKMLYASHYFWTALELRVLVPDPGRGAGFWFLMVSRSRSDGLSGFTGALLRGRVRSEAQDGTRAALAATKTKLEATAR